MAVVDVDVVRLEDFFEFVNKGLSCCLYSKHFVYLIDVVTEGSPIVYLLMAQTISKIDACSFKYDLLMLFFI